MFDTMKTHLKDAKHIVVIQAENPDGDSLGSALALEEILSDLGKTVTLYCPINIPSYLRYFSGWDRVTDDFPSKADMAIIVDTSSDTLLGKVLEAQGVRHFLESHPVFVIDHHTTESTLTFEHYDLSEKAAATSEIILKMANELEFNVNTTAAEHLLGSLLADTLGLSTQGVTAGSYRIAGQLVELGAHPSVIENKRREFMKKSAKILAYKGRLIDRIEYLCDGKVALVHVPFEEIQEFSNEYNPGALIGDELRLVKGVEVSCVIKTYPDGKLTGRLRSNSPIAESIAGYFGGGGHDYTAGFRVYEQYDTVIKELVTATEKALAERKL